MNICKYLIHTCKLECSIVHIVQTMSIRQKVEMSIPRYFIRNIKQRTVATTNQYSRPTCSSH